MDISDKCFKYGDRASVIRPNSVTAESNRWYGLVEKDYDFRFLYIETEPMTKLHGDVAPVYVQNNKSATRKPVGRDYENSALLFEAEIVSEYPIDPRDLRVIERWLFQNTGFQKLYATDDNGNRIDGEEITGSDGTTPRYTYLNCLFCNPERVIHSGGCFGWKCTVECDSYLAHQDAVSYKFSPAMSTGTYSVNVDSDKFGYTWPTIVIKLGTVTEVTTDLYITNTTLGDASGAPRQLVFLGIPCSSGNTITIDCVTNTAVIGSTNLLSFFPNNADQRNFIGLLNGTNEVTVALKKTGTQTDSQNVVTSVGFIVENMRYTRFAV